MSAPLAHLLISFLNVLVWIIIARALLSWFVRDPSNPLMRLLSTLTDPMMQPFRKYLTFGMMDLTPIAFILALNGLMSVIGSSVVP